VTTKSAAVSMTKCPTNLCATSEQREIPSSQTTNEID